MSTKTYAVQVRDAQIMTSALQSNLEMLKKYGINQEFVDTLNETMQQVVEKKSEHERLKGELKSATVALEALKSEMGKKMRKAVTIVKLEVPQAGWKEFGIQAKR